MQACIHVCMYAFSLFSIYGHLICLQSFVITENAMDVSVCTVLGNLLLEGEFLEMELLAPRVYVLVCLGC